MFTDIHIARRKREKQQQKNRLIKSILTKVGSLNDNMLDIHTQKMNPILFSTIQTQDAIVSQAASMGTSAKTASSNKNKDIKESEIRNETKPEHKKDENVDKEKKHKVKKREKEKEKHIITIDTSSI